LHQHDDTHGDHDHPASDDHCWYRGGAFRDELTSHLPFSILSVTLGLMLAGVICFFADDNVLAGAADVAAGLHQHDPDDAHAGHDHSHDHNHTNISAFLVLFHLFHPAHMLFSAAATAAMFFRYDRSITKAALIGFSGAVIVCGISDIIMPYLSAKIMGKTLELHLCIREHPMVVIPFAAIGVGLGILAAAGGTVKSTIFSHSLHVATSTMASIFYLIGPFGRLEWIHNIGTVFFYITLAVVIPCCLSDIVYPLMFNRDARDEYSRTGHDHPH
jgi:hypothetical protein